MITKQLDDEFTHPTGRILKDGEKLRIPHLLMDAAPDGIADITRRALAGAAPMHRPGSLALSDASALARETAIIERKAALSDAWRNPPALDAEPAAPTADTATTADAQYDARCANLESAWRGAA